MLPRLNRILCALAAIVGLAGLSILPPEHVHAHQDDHHAAVVHRHFAPHDHDDHASAGPVNAPLLQPPDDDGRTVPVVFIASARHASHHVECVTIAVTPGWGIQPLAALHAVGAFAPAPHPSPPAAAIALRAPPQFS